VGEWAERYRPPRVSADALLHACDDRERDKSHGHLVVIFRLYGEHSQAPTPRHKKTLYVAIERRRKLLRSLHVSLPALYKDAYLLVGEYLRSVEAETAGYWAGR
jgi:hypothetical protein